MHERPDQSIPLTQINSRVPLVAEQVINTALAKNPADRYPDVKTFLMKLLAVMWETLHEEDELSSDSDIVAMPVSGGTKTVSLPKQFKDITTPLPESRWDGPITQPLPGSSWHDLVTSSSSKVDSLPTTPIPQPVWEQQFTYPVSGPNEGFPSTGPIPPITPAALDFMNKTEVSTEEIPRALCIDSVMKEYMRKHHVVPRYLYVSPELWKDIEEGGVFDGSIRSPYTKESKDEHI